MFSLHVLGSHMTPELFAGLKDHKTSKGYSLSNSMQGGVCVCVLQAQVHV